MGRIIKKGFFWGQKSLLKLWSVTIGFLLSTIFGSLSGCTATMYGIPSADYKIKGRVTNTSGLGLDSIEVSSYFGDSVVTDSNGNYSLETTEYGSSLELSFRDIGENNGNYADRDTSMQFKKSQFKNGDGLYWGTISVDVNIKLDSAGTDETQD